MNLTIHNTPDAPPTFCNPMGESSIDVTLSRGDFSISGWRVPPDASCSDHRLIVYEFIPRVAQDPQRAAYNFRYKTKGANWALFGSLFVTHTKDFSRSSLSAEESAEILSETFTYCADVSIGRGSITNTCRCDWWNDRLADLRFYVVVVRSFCYRKARRKLNTINKHNVTGDLYNNALIALRLARSHYRAAVEKSKGNLIHKLVDKLDREGPWSPLYHEFKANKLIDLAYIQNIKINNRYTTGVEQTAEYLLESRVPNDTDHHRQIRQWAIEPPLSPMSNLPASDEFLGIIRSLPLNKASGDDKISNKMIKEACKLSGDTIFTVFKRCIAEGIFPRIWRCGNIRIISKSGDKPPDDPKSYRPITLLPSLGKLLEGLVVPQLLPGGVKFHNRQFGFTLGKSTTDAVISVRKFVTESKFQYVLAIFLDISGAFDNTWWPMLLLKLKSRGISTATWGLSFNTLKIIYGATYLGSMCYGAPVWADRATVGAVRRKLLQGQRLALIFLCKAYRTVSTEALPVLAGVLPVDLEVQRRAAMYYSRQQNMECDFLGARDRGKITRLLQQQPDVYNDLIDEWPQRWDESSKGRHLYQFFPSVRERLSRIWLEVDLCVAQFLTGHGNFKSKLYPFKLVESPLCQCSTPNSHYEQSAHHILWECSLWYNERNIMLNSLQVTSGAVYYGDLVSTRVNFRAFRRPEVISCISPLGKPVSRPPVTCSGYTQYNDRIRSALEDAILEYRYLNCNDRPRLFRLPIHKRNLALVGALDSLLPEYLDNSEDLSDTHSILYCAAIAVCRVAGVKIADNVTTTRPKSTVPAWQYRIERRIAETRTLIGKLISYRSGNTRPRVMRFVKQAFLGTTISPQQYMSCVTERIDFLKQKIYA
ncbi:unnamed protein product [Arctia plantaginis]|uniref:Reverse transcriptase domain-containing protein n=1 Tax=Arctia plantaginis TaxID=874455 RepID=A0A8S1A467_ARCPL|nr:unnamed protein product [Arctia plantaginis]